MAAENIYLIYIINCDINFYLIIKGYIFNFYFIIIYILYFLYIYKFI